MYIYLKEICIYTFISCIGYSIYKFYKYVNINDKKVRFLLEKIVINSTDEELIAICRKYNINLCSCQNELKNFIEDLDKYNQNKICFPHLLILEQYKSKFTDFGLIIANKIIEKNISTILLNNNNLVILELDNIINELDKDIESFQYHKIEISTKKWKVKLNSHLLNLKNI